VWIPIVGGALAAGGLVVGRRRAARAKEGDPIADYARRFWLSHEALRRNLDRFVTIIDRDEEFDVAAFGEYVGIFGQFLIVHHESEDEVVFPTLRRHGRLKSTDAAHLDGWTGEHRLVNAAGEALARAGQNLRGGSRAGLKDVVSRSRDLGELLRPHLAAEEQLFTAEHLAEIIPPEAVGEIDRAARSRFSRVREVPLFFAHSLAPEEQKQVFAAAPWIFRRVILPMMDRRTFPRFVPFTVSPVLRV
jgi:hypothetical protein